MKWYKQHVTNVGVCPECSGDSESVYRYFITTESHSVRCRRCGETWESILEYVSARRDTSDHPITIRQEDCQRDVESFTRPVGFAQKVRDLVAHYTTTSSICPNCGGRVREYPVTLIAFRPLIFGVAVASAVFVYSILPTGYASPGAFGGLLGLAVLAGFTHSTKLDSEDTFRQCERCQRVWATELDYKGEVEEEAPDDGDEPENVSEALPSPSPADY